jgi:hypothetical protein
LSGSGCFSSWYSAGAVSGLALVSDGSNTPPDRILVDEPEVAPLAEQFQRTWMRPPTRQEMEGLAEDFVKEEILFPRLIFICRFLA